VRNDGPGGAEGQLVPSPGVDRAGGANGPIECLRARIRALERAPVSLAFSPALGTSRPACSPPPPGSLLEAPPPDPRLRGEPPLGKLKRSGLHEIKAAAYRDAPAALTFALAALGESLARRDAAPGLVLWCVTERAAREWGRPYAPGLMGLGLDSALFLIVEARTAQDAAWALEEGLKSRSLIAALAQIELTVPLMARRLGHAAKASRTPCLLLSSHQATGLPGTLTRWRVAAAASRAASFDAGAPGVARWQLTLERCRGIAPEQSWTVEWRDASDGFCVAPPLADRAVATGAGGAPRRALTA